MEYQSSSLVDSKRGECTQTGLGQFVQRCNVDAIEIESSNREAWMNEATAAIYNGVDMNTLMNAARIATQEWVDAECELGSCNRRDCISCRTGTFCGNNSRNGSGTGCYSMCFCCNRS